MVTALRAVGEAGRDDRDRAVDLSLRSGTPFWSLRGLRPDGRLFLYLPLEVAERELAFPVALEGDWLTVAVAELEPDLTVVAERFPRLHVELVIASRGELIEALAIARERLR